MSLAARPEAPPPPPPPERPKVGVVAALAVVVVAVVASGAVAVVVRTGGVDPVRRAGGTTTTGAPPPGPTQPPPAPPPPAGPLAGLVADLSAFVEAERGRRFERPVSVELLEGQAFRDRLLRDAEEGREDTETTEALMRALKLIDPDVDLFEVVTGFLGDAVVGFYDAERDELVVRGGEVTPLVRGTLVHELTHALEDQRYELDRPELEDPEDESSLAFSALVEGDALRVEDAYRAGLSPSERAQLRSQEVEQGAGVDFFSVPSVVAAMISFPYQAGPDFVAAVLAEGGEDRLDETFRDPPTTSEQIFDPAVYLRGEPVVGVDRPRPEGEVVDEGVYGQLALLLTLADAVDFSTAVEAATGWGGDAYVAWGRGEATCVRAAFAMDTPRDLEELTAALRDWAAAHGDATVDDGSERVTVTACG